MDLNSTFFLLLLFPLPPSSSSYLDRLLVTKQLDARHAELALRACLGGLEAEREPAHGLMICFFFFPRVARSKCCEFFFHFLFFFSFLHARHLPQLRASSQFDYTRGTISVCYTPCDREGCVGGEREERK